MINFPFHKTEAVRNPVYAKNYNMVFSSKSNFLNSIKNLFGKWKAIVRCRETKTAEKTFC